jgi:alanyl-tRNA synthetase
MGRRGIVILGTIEAGKVVLVALVSEDLVREGLHAGKIINDLAKIVGGGGGGRADFAQAGGKEPSKLEEALDKAPDIVRENLKSRKR